MIDKDLDDALSVYFKDSGVDYKKEERPPRKKIDLGKNTIARTQSKGSITTISKLGKTLKDLLDAAWGSSWGLISPETAKGDDGKKIITPQISYSLNLREVAEGTSPKPKLMDVEHESVNGMATGDVFQIYRQWFDCIVEFNFWDTTSKSCDELAERFEKLMVVFANGYLKENGISEIFFLKEVPPEYSLKFAEGMPMRCLYYFVRIERGNKVRLEEINAISQALKIKKQ